MKEIRKIVEAVYPENESNDVNVEVESDFKQLLIKFESEPTYFQQVIRPMLSPGHENELIFWFKDLGLIKNEFKCKNAGKNERCSLLSWSSSRVNDGYQWRCNNCGEKRSIREDSIFDNVKCSFTDGIRIVLGWCKGIDLDTMAGMLGVKKHVIGTLYKRLAAVAEDFIKTNLEDWRLGNVGKLILIDTYPEGCSNSNPARGRSILCLSEIGSFPQRYWLESLGACNNSQQVKNNILNTIKNIVRPGSGLIIPSNSSLFSIDDIKSLNDLYPIIVEVDVLARHNTESCTLEGILETIWKNILDVCEEAQYYGAEYIQEFIFGSLWRRKYENASFERLIYQIAG